jgi:hypothetical protein
MPNLWAGLFAMDIFRAAVKMVLRPQFAMSVSDKFPVDVGQIKFSKNWMTTG